MKRIGKGGSKIIVMWGIKDVGRIIRVSDTFGNLSSDHPRMDVDFDRTHLTQLLKPVLFSNFKLMRRSRVTLILSGKKLVFSRILLCDWHSRFDYSNLTLS